MINSDNSIQINIKFTFTEYEYIIAFNNVLYKAKIVSKTQIFCKIFCFLYRSFVSFIKSKKTSNKNQHSN